MHSVSPRSKPILVTLALLGLSAFLVLVCATAALADRLEYAEGVEPRDGIGHANRSVTQVALGQHGYPLTTGRARFVPAPPAPTDAIPASIIACESKGSYTAENPGPSTASGKYQIVDGTWNGYGGFSHAADAPPHVQDAKARELWAGGAGRHHWRQCL